MRTATFNTLGSIVCGVILFSAYVVAACFELRFPRTDWYVVDLAIDWIESDIFKLIMAFLMLPVYVFVMTPLLKKLRAWRKRHGRDIEEEEKYETDFGLISLTEKTHKNGMESENHLLNRGIQWYRRRPRN